MNCRAVAFLSCLLVSACASASVTAPAQPNIERTRQVAVPFETAWSRSVDWFANNNITIDKIEKPSGLITARYKILVDESILDCGKLNMTGVLGEPDIERFGTLNVTVREIDAATTRVTANLFGEFRAVGRDSWDGRPVVIDGRCTSTGMVEQKFFESISS